MTEAVPGGLQRMRDIVAQVPLFATLGPDKIDVVATMLRAVDLPSDITLIRRGDPGDCMYFIADGEVEVDLPGKTLRLGDGAFFGEMALLGNNPRGADIRTVKASRLLVLDLADFRTIVARHPELGDIIAAEAKRRAFENA